MRRLMMRALPVIAFSVALSAQAQNAPEPAPTPIQKHVAQLRWQPGPPSLPPGVEAVVLEGDPRQAGLFTMRLRVPAGTRLLPHTHPKPERVTVLSGALGLGLGTRFDPMALRVFGPGDYYVNPPGLAHYLSFAQDTEVQITTEGPWGLEYLPH